MSIKSPWKWDGVEIAGQRAVRPFPPRSDNWVYSIHTHRESANPSGGDQRTYASTNMTSDIPDPDDVTEAQLAEHFEGRALRDPRRYYKNGGCKRCRETEERRQQRW